MIWYCNFHDIICIISSIVAPNNLHARHRINSSNFCSMQLLWTHRVLSFELRFTLFISAKLNCSLYQVPQQLALDSCQYYSFLIFYWLNEANWRFHHFQAKQNLSTLIHQSSSLSPAPLIHSLFRKKEQKQIIFKFKKKIKCIVYSQICVSW